MKYVKEILNEIPKIFRYLIPGFVLSFFLMMSFPSMMTVIQSNWGNKYFYIIMLLAGMVIYQIHRLLFWFIDEIIFLCKGHDFWRFFKDRYGKSKHLGDKGLLTNEAIELAAMAGYMEYRNSILHSCLITSELGIIFSLCSSPTSWVHAHRIPICPFSIFIFVVSILLYIRQCVLEIKHMKNAA